MQNYVSNANIIGAIKCETQERNMWEWEHKMAVNKENDTWQVVIYGRRFKGKSLTVPTQAELQERGTRKKALEELFTEC